MTVKWLGIAAAVLVIDTVLLLVIGIFMWKGAPDDAQEAVGMGLVALGVVLFVPALVMVWAWLDASPSTAKVLEQSRSDWDEA